MWTASDASPGSEQTSQRKRYEERRECGDKDKRSGEWAGLAAINLAMVHLGLGDDPRRIYCGACPSRAQVPEDRQGANGSGGKRGRTARGAGTIQGEPAKGNVVPTHPDRFRAEEPSYASLVHPVG